jgi:hypothetical protein
MKSKIDSRHPVNLMASVNRGHFQKSPNTAERRKWVLQVTIVAALLQQGEEF